MSRDEDPAGPARGRRHPSAAVRLCLAALLLSPIGHALAQPATSHSVEDVVELFTSQGCSSCPPADRVLSDLAGSPATLALSYHVDYWDYIGWIDPFASPRNTERQRAYARAFGETTIHTPQMIVNGAHELTGADRGAIDAALSEPAETARTAEIRIERDGETLRLFAQGVAPSAGSQTVLILVSYGESRTTVVQRGENEGRELVNSHPVRDWQMVGKIKDRPIEVEMPMAGMTDDEGRPLGWAAFLQVMAEDGVPGPIVAAAMLPPGR